MSRKRGWRYWINLLGVGIVWGVLLLYLGYLGLWARSLARPARSPLCCITPADLGHDYEEVALTAADGVTLLGWYIPSHNGAAVILLHGYGANRVQMVKRAGLLANHGYGALLYDQRASGESEGAFRTFGWLDVDDVPLALEFLLRREDVAPRRVGILGFSQGGQIALRAAAASDRLRAVVAEEPGFSTLDDLPPEMGLEERWVAFNYRLTFKSLSWWTGVRDASGVVESLPQVDPRPIFFIAARPPEEPGYWLVHHYYDAATGPRAWWHVPEAAHGEIPDLRSDEYEDRVVTFFDQALLREGD